MSTQFNLDKNHTNLAYTHGKVRVTDLLNRLNEEKKIEKKRNLALGVAAVSAACVGALANPASAATRQSDSAKGGTNDFIDLSLPKEIYGNPQYLTCDLLSPHGIVSVPDCANSF